jgi:hypothetical protein
MWTQYNTWNALGYGAAPSSSAGTVLGDAAAMKAHDQANFYAAGAIKRYGKDFII